MPGSHRVKAFRIRYALLQGGKIENPAGSEDLFRPGKMFVVRQDNARIRDRVFAAVRPFPTGQAVLKLLLPLRRQGRVDQAVERSGKDSAEKGGYCIRVLFHKYNNRTSLFCDRQKRASHTPAQIEQL